MAGTEHGLSTSHKKVLPYRRLTRDYRAADASSHLFFAYLRSRAPEAVDGITGISALPRSLQALIAQTEYPPDTPALMQTSTYKVVMIVDAVSSTPFALLRRAKHFEFRDDDHVLREFSSHSDPVSALTEECRRVLESISSANQSMAARSRRANLAGARLPSGLPNPEDDSWYRFQDQGFSSFEPANTVQSSVTPPAMQSPGLGSLQSAAQSKQNFGGRPTTPSWADFLNSGFADDGSDKTPQILLPPGKQLPPFGLDRSESMFSLDDSDDLEPGELASISQFELDDSFWWVWMTSLASEEPPNRKGAFGRCALIETLIPGGRWLVMEEQVKGAAPSPEIGAYIAEKKSRFGFSKRSRSTRRNRTIKEHVSSEPFGSPVPAVPNKRSITAEEVTLIKAAAARLNQEQSFPPNLLGEPNVRRGRYDDAASTKTNSVMTLGITKEAGPAMKWANSYDKEAVRKQYLGDNFAGKGFGRDDASSRYSMFTTDNELKPIVSAKSTERELPPTPFTGTGTEPERVAGNNEEVLPAPLPPKRSEYVPEVVEAQTSHAAQVHSPVATPYEEHFVPAEAPVEVPLPDPSPYEETTLPQVQEQSPRSTYTGSPASQKVGREPLPQEPDQPAVHPAFRNQDIHDDTTGPVQEASAAAMGARAAWKAQQKPSSPPKAAKKKHGATAGLIKMFNRKKEDVHRRPAPEVATSKKTLQAPSEVSLGRRLSLMRRKDPKPTEEQTPEPQVQEVRSNGGQSNAFEPQVMAESLNVEGESRPTTQHLEEAHEEFSKFDQGPITDAPAFAPRSSVDTDVSRDFDGPSVPRYRPDETEQEPRHEAVEHTSPSTMDESFSAKDPVSPVVDSESPTLAYSNDRWAQIRRNAAERAARGSEDTSLQSHDQSNLTERTDEGETSGEESEYIESQEADDWRA